MPTGQALLPNLVSTASSSARPSRSTPRSGRSPTIAGPALGGVAVPLGRADRLRDGRGAARARGAAHAAWCVAAASARRRPSAPELRHAAVGAALRVVAPAGARCDLARPVRGAVRRRDSAAAGVRRGRAARRARAGSAGCAPRPASALRCCGLLIGLSPITRRVGRWMFGGVIVVRPRDAHLRRSRRSFWLSRRGTHGAWAPATW